MILLRRYPVLKASFTSFSLFTIGDLIAQTIIPPVPNPLQENDSDSESKKYDLIRTSHFSIVGAAVHGPYFYKAFQWLDGFWSKRFPAPALVPALATGSGSSLPSTTSARKLRFFNNVQKSLFSQMVIFPPYLVMFLVTLGVLERKGIDIPYLKEKLANQGSQMLMTSSLVWPVLNTVNFAFIGPESRILFINVCGICWNSWLSFLNSYHAKMLSGEKMQN